MVVTGESSFTNSVLKSRGDKWLTTQRNGSQFVISTAALPHLDGKNVVFGEVVEGLNLVQRIEKLGSFDGLPRAEVVIVKSGVVE